MFESAVNATTYNDRVVRQFAIMTIVWGEGSRYSSGFHGENCVRLLSGKQAIARIFCRNRENQGMLVIDSA